ncbi:hypothetical protein ACLOJK_008728 [Asimina triloba]
MEPHLSFLKRCDAPFRFGYGGGKGFSILYSGGYNLSCLKLLVGLMLAGMGATSDVFRMASSRWEKRQAKVLEKAKIRMWKQKDPKKAGSYWDNLWGKPKNYQASEEEVKERAKRAAAAARRWREYSRNGADKPPTFKLPEAVSNKE